MGIPGFGLPGPGIPPSRQISFGRPWRNSLFPQNAKNCYPKVTRSARLHLTEQAPLHGILR